MSCSIVVYSTSTGNTWMTLELLGGGSAAQVQLVQKGVQLQIVHYTTVNATMYLL